jgi:hypothetical protein
MGEGEATAAPRRGWGLRAPNARHPVSKARGPIAAILRAKFHDGDKKALRAPGVG